MAHIWAYNGRGHVLGSLVITGGNWDLIATYRSYAAGIEKWKVLSRDTNAFELQ